MRKWMTSMALLAVLALAGAMPAMAGGRLVRMGQAFLAARRQA